MKYVDREMLKGFLPVLVLSCLKEKPIHGYALCKVLHEKHGERLRLGIGTIYPLLKRLETKSLVTSKVMEKPPAKPQRVYSITTEGKAHFKLKRKEITELFEIMNDAFDAKEPKKKSGKSKKKKK